MHRSFLALVLIASIPDPSYAQSKIEPFDGYGAVYIAQTDEGNALHDSLLSLSQNPSAAEIAQSDGVLKIHRVLRSLETRSHLLHCNITNSYDDVTSISDKVDQHSISLQPTSASGERSCFFLYDLAPNAENEILPKQLMALENSTPELEALLEPTPTGFGKNLGYSSLIEEFSASSATLLETGNEDTLVVSLPFKGGSYLSHAAITEKKHLQDPKVSDYLDDGSSDRFMGSLRRIKADEGAIGVCIFTTNIQHLQLQRRNATRFVRAIESELGDTTLDKFEFVFDPSVGGSTLYDTLLEIEDLAVIFKLGNRSAEQAVSVSPKCVDYLPEVYSEIVWKPAESYSSTTVAQYFGNSSTSLSQRVKTLLDTEVSTLVASINSNSFFLVEGYASLPSLEANIGANLRISYGRMDFLIGLLSEELGDATDGTTLVLGSYAGPVSLLNEIGSNQKNLPRLPSASEARSRVGYITRFDGLEVSDAELFNDFLSLNRIRTLTTETNFQAHRSSESARMSSTSVARDTLVQYLNSQPSQLANNGRERVGIFGCNFPELSEKRWSSSFLQTLKNELIQSGLESEISLVTYLHGIPISAEEKSVAIFSPEILGWSHTADGQLWGNKLCTKYNGTQINGVSQDCSDGTMNVSSSLENRDVSIMLPSFLSNPSECIFDPLTVAEDLVNKVVSGDEVVTEFGPMTFSWPSTDLTVRPVK